MTDPAIEGDLRWFIPVEILQFLGLAQATGRLVLDREHERAEVFVERGRPVFARTNRGSVRTGELLLHRGQVTQDALGRALEAQAVDGASEPLGAILTRMGATSVEQVRQAVQEVVRRVLFGMLLWNEGRFRFYAGVAAPRRDLPIDIELDRLILEALRQVDERRASGAH